MQQVLFQIPFTSIPIYGYGFMLFCAFLGCTLLAVRLGARVGYPKAPMQDLVVWLMVSGIVGARLTYIIRYWERFDHLGQLFAVWDGGLIFYGSIPGALVGYTIAYNLQLRHYNVSHWKIADIVAPGLALGLCLGRVGCLLNGCCFGNVACGSCPAVEFPFSSPPRQVMVERGHITPAGFLTGRDDATVLAVEPMSPLAAMMGPGDKVKKVVAPSEKEPFDAVTAFGPKWPRGERRMELEVEAPNGIARRVGPVAPSTIGLHPTQIYESISMALLLFFLLSYYPYKTRDASLMVIFMFAYGIHRFLNEMLRTDTEVVAFGLTLSQNISVAVLIAATVLAVIVWRKKQETIAAVTPPVVSTISN